MRLNCRRKDVGELKVAALAAALAEIDAEVRVETIADRYRPRIVLGEAVFCCVDSISAGGGDLAIGRQDVWVLVRRPNAR